MSDLKDLLEKLHCKTAAELLTRIESGEATAAEFTAAINLLKHNGIECTPSADKNVERLKKILPFAMPAHPDQLA